MAMIDHGTTCAGEPCTCDCYTRHVPFPGVHQDTPHPKSQCMTDLHATRRRPEQLAEMKAEGNAEHCPHYCTTHNHEEMGG